jgi:hypothetical protein
MGPGRGRLRAPYFHQAFKRPRALAKFAESLSRAQATSRQFRLLKQFGLLRCSCRTLQCWSATLLDAGVPGSSPDRIPRLHIQFIREIGVVKTKRKSWDVWCLWKRFLYSFN